MEVFEFSFDLKSGRIPSDLNSLNALNQLFPWVPNSNQIRPTQDVIDQKLSVLQEIESQWRSVKDYIAHKELGVDFNHDYFSRKKYVDYDLIVDIIRFNPNNFPYQLSTGYHYILWVSPTKEFPNGVIPDEHINCEIQNAIVKIAGENSKFRFFWYENPKMTVPEIYHIQVFWMIEGMHNDG